MRSIAENTPDLSCFTEDDIAAAVKKLNSGKAQCPCGLVAEHLKYAGEALIPALTHVLNLTRSAWSITAQLKAGYKIPIPKKGKDPLMQDNHSGITITNLLESS